MEPRPCDLASDSIYCVWDAGYGMCIAGDLKTASDVDPDFQRQAAQIAGELGLEFTRGSFALPAAAMQAEYFERFDRLAGLSWQAKRVERAQSARLATRIHHGEVDAFDDGQAEAIALGQMLYGGIRDSEGPCSFSRAGQSAQGGVDSDNPRSLVHRLEMTSPGCRWLLEQWGELRAILDRGTPWLAPDQFRAVRLLGRRSTDVLYSEEVVLVYLSGHVLLNQGGDPFQEILNELSPQDVPVYSKYLQLRHYDDLVPGDAAAARSVLLEIVDRAIAGLVERAKVLRQLAEADAPWAAQRLLWDDSAEGERLRRYELSCDRAWLRMLELIRKVRRTGEELDIASLRHPAFHCAEAADDGPAPVAATVITAPIEPVTRPERTIEASSEPESAPNEPNFSGDMSRNERAEVPRVSESERRHARHRADGGRSGQAAFHQELERQVAGRNSPLLDVSSIL